VGAFLVVLAGIFTVSYATPTIVIGSIGKGLGDAMVEMGVTWENYDELGRRTKEGVVGAEKLVCHYWWSSACSRFCDLEEFKDVKAPRCLKLNKAPYFPDPDSMVAFFYLEEGDLHPITKAWRDHSDDMELVASAESILSKMSINRYQMGLDEKGVTLMLNIANHGVDLTESMWKLSDAYMDVLNAFSTYTVSGEIFLDRLERHFMVGDILSWSHAFKDLEEDIKIAQDLVVVAIKQTSATNEMLTDTQNKLREASQILAPGKAGILEADHKIEEIKNAKEKASQEENSRYVNWFSKYDEKMKQLNMEERAVLLDKYKVACCVHVLYKCFRFSFLLYT